MRFNSLFEKLQYFPCLFSKNLLSGLKVKTKVNNFIKFSQLFSSFSTSPKGNGNDSCQQVSRKKRRGVIEKKRRDRINSSLSELKRLVPSAYEKQGSSKLEKAEILQLTVDHLKSMNARGKHFNQFFRCVFLFCSFSSYAHCVFTRRDDF